MYKYREQCLSLESNQKKIIMNGKNQSSSWVMASGKNAERERTRVRSLRQAFQTLQSCLPSVPPDTKLSKLDILILATNYITLLMQTLGCFDYQSCQHHHHQGQQQQQPVKVYRPIKKWPMRSRLYSTMFGGDDYFGNQPEIEHHHYMPQENL